MIRFLLLNAIIAGLSILFCISGLVLSLFDHTGGRLIHNIIARPWARSILWVCGVKALVKGLENLDPGVPRIYLSNHQSYFDIFALLAHLPLHFKFVMKKELMKVPLLGPTMRKAGYIGIDREDPRQAIKGMNAAAERVKKGASILLFPEGTRSLDGRLQEFRPGGFHLALKAGCDVVPIVILNSRFIVPKGSLRISKGTISLNIGRPISLTDFSRKDMPRLMAQVRDTMKAMMGEEVP